MKQLNAVYIILFLCSACNVNQKKDSDMIIASNCDTLRISRYMADSTRTILYENNEKTNSNVFIYGKQKRTIGLIKNQAYDGRFYVFDTSNIITTIEYYVNNQKIYSHNTHKNNVTFKDIFAIKPDNIPYISPPIIEYRELDSNKAKVKFLSVNYPLVLSEFSTSSPNSFDGSSFSRNVIEESEEAVLKIEGRPVQLNFSYCDKDHNVIKAFMWKSSDTDMTFKEVKKW